MQTANEVYTEPIIVSEEAHVAAMQKTFDEYSAQHAEKEQLKAELADADAVRTSVPRALSSVQNMVCLS